MAADSKFDTVDSLINKSAIVESGAEKKKSGEFWLRIYTKDAEGAAKLPYDVCLDSMPILKGSSEFARKNNNFLKQLYIQCSEHLNPGDESGAMPLVIKVYRKSSDTTADLAAEEEEKLSFF